jgi:hypothetical protein
VATSQQLITITHPIKNTIRKQPTKYSNDTQCYGDIPTPINDTAIWRIIGGSVNDIKPYGVLILPPAPSPTGHYPP